ncbi:hypothetical protein LTR37_020424 [Vermiconidia calcicola]|uniref:Uncharacterized protein n=1 Tax=Vermiconidia calcicola TaxID=1690605 RepID=A0ACC3MB86_9PEZI|nr:hypothetical protein LTR37_020424 [Vermiconidia calcicola]
MVFYMPEGVYLEFPPWFWCETAAEVEKCREVLSDPTRLALLQTCRPIRDEAERIFYSIVAFHKHDYGRNVCDSLIVAFMNATSAARLESMTRLSTSAVLICGLTEVLTLVCDSMPRLTELRLTFYSSAPNIFKAAVEDYHGGGKQLMKEALGRLNDLQTLEVDFATSYWDYARIEDFKAELQQMFSEVKARRTMEGGYAGGGSAA